MRKRIYTVIGIAMIAAAALLAAYNVWDDWRAGRAAEEVMEQLKAARERREQSEAAAPAHEEETKEEEKREYYWPETGEMETVALEAGECVGTVTIPRLGRSLPVMSEWSYALLKKAPCRYSGSIYTRDMVIAGHNYRTHFGGYRALTEGDSVYFTDVKGNEYEYSVVSVETVKPTAIEEMTTGEGWDLTLFTCTNGGSARYAVRCALVW